MLGFTCFLNISSVLQPLHLNYVFTESGGNPEHSWWTHLEQKSHI